MTALDREYLNEKFSLLESNITLKIENINISVKSNTERVKKLESETRVVRFFSKFPIITSFTVIGLLCTNLVSLILLIKKFM